MYLQSWTFNPLCNGSSLPMLLTIDFLAQFFQFCGQHWKERRKKVDYSTCARMMSLTRVSCNVSRCSMRHSDKLNPLSSKSNRNINFFTYTYKDHLRETFLSLTQFSKLTLQECTELSLKNLYVDSGATEMSKEAQSI